MLKVLLLYVVICCNKKSFAVHPFSVLLKLAIRILISDLKASFGFVYSQNYGSLTRAADISEQNLYNIMVVCKKILYSVYIPGTQMIPVLIGKGLLLEG